jgi:MEMO1 family protein
VTQRPAAVAGQFYCAQGDALRSQVEGYLPQQASKSSSALAIVVPHAGYVYSGATAGGVYSRITVPDLVVVLCPNHTGAGAPVSVWSRGAWQTPLGAVAVAEKLAADFLSHCPEAQEDQLAHLREHSLEVQLPFLQVLNPKAKILPICLGTRDQKILAAVGQALAIIIENLKQTVLLVASSDMTHFESASSAAGRDELALAQVRALDPAGLLEVVESQRISMCGASAVAATLYAAKAQGASSCKLIDYTHSGQVTGDDSNVVAYAGMIIE